MEICRWVMAFGLFAMLTTTVMDISADESETKSQAVAAFQAGKILFREEKYKEAADKFREAYQLKPSWKLYFNIAQSEASAKRHGLALDAFEAFLTQGGDDIPVDRRDQVLSEVERLRKIVGYLKVRAPAGTVVFVDDVVRGKAPVQILVSVSAGSVHVVRGDLDNVALEPQRFRVTGGQTVTVELTPSTAPDAQDGAPEPPEDERVSPASDNGNDVVSPTQGEEGKKKSPLVLPGWIITGIGAAALVGGAVTGGIALSKNAELKDICGDDPCPEMKDEEQSRTKMSASSTALIAAGGTVFATGVVLLVLGKLQEKRERPPVAVVPSVGKEAAMTSLEWRF